MSYRRIILWSIVIVALGVSILPAQFDPAMAQSRPRIITSFSILADIAAQVAGDSADVEALIPLGANPHAYEPSARDIVRLSEADAVLVVGVNFEEGLLPVLAESAGDRVVVVSECIPIRPVLVGTVTLERDHVAEEYEGGLHKDELHGEIAVACEAYHQTVAGVFGLDEASLHGDEFLGPLYALDCGGDEHEHEHEAEGEHIHAAGSCDPHVWMDPVNAGLWTLKIRDTLIALDPDHADSYTANAEAYLAALADVHGQIQTILAALAPERRYLVTNHLAFNYFAQRYGLTQIGVVIPGGSTTSEPSVQEVITLLDTIRAYDVPAIFTEATVSDDLARQIADEGGAKVVPLYTGSLSDSNGPASTYLDYTLANATMIAESLK